MSEFKVEFSDTNVSAQYDHSASNIASIVEGSHPPLFVGDRDSLSMVQISHRNIEKVINILNTLGYVLDYDLTKMMLKNKTDRSLLFYAIKRG